jgi:NTF2-related export protein 1/2
MAEIGSNSQDQTAETVIQGNSPSAPKKRTSRRPSCSLIHSIAAKSFLEPFYDALQSSRETISSFYAQVPTPPDALNLEYNGNKYKDGKDVQAMFESEMPPAHFEILTYNCHRLNRDYAGTGRPSFLVMVSGILRTGKGRKKGDLEPAIEYSETFVLIPNQQVASNVKDSTSKRWLIQSQVFRKVAQIPGSS